MKKSTSGRLALRLTGAISRFIINTIFYLVVVFAIIKGADYVYHFAYQVFGSVAKEEAPGTNVPVQIFRGETTMNIASKLETSLLIVDKYSFLLKTKLKEYNIMPGTYILNTSMDYNDILDIITNPANSIAQEESIEDSKKPSGSEEGGKNEGNAGAESEGNSGASDPGENGNGTGNSSGKSSRAWEAGETGNGAAVSGGKSGRALEARETGNGAAVSGGKSSRALEARETGNGAVASGGKSGSALEAGNSRNNSSVSGTGGAA